MIHALLLEHTDSDVDYIVNKANSGDIIFTESIRLYNSVIKLLKETKPDSLIYVRILQFGYFPHIAASEEENAKSDDEML